MVLTTLIDPRQQMPQIDSSSKVMQRTFAGRRSRHVARTENEALCTSGERVNIHENQQPLRT